ncbi:MAG: Rid family detoxifying hydrolase [Spirosomaceae bacterium]|nr:Rid family detoxifying hydrolase [Spirosomataceae bacterium]
MKKLVLTSIFALFLTLGFAQNKTIVKTANAPQPAGPYSQAVIANGMIYVAGQVGRNPETRALAEGGTTAECRQIMENIKAILQEARTDLSAIVNTNIYLTDVNDFTEVNKIYGSYFTNNFPARTTVGVAALPGGSHIEIAVIAVAKD